MARRNGVRLEEPKAQPFSVAVCASRERSNLCLRLLAIKTLIRYLLGLGLYSDASSVFGFWSLHSTDDPHRLIEAFSVEDSHSIKPLVEPRRIHPRGKTEYLAIWLKPQTERSSKDL